MLYHLLYPLSEDYVIFNLFRYITFRSIYAVVTGLAITLVVGPWFIRYLQKKEIGERIRDDGPVSHHIKSGTPTMGGLLILLSLLFSTLLWTDLGNSYIWIAIVSLVLYGSIGFYDDWLKLQKIQNGLSARGKLLLQFVSAFIIVWLLYVAQGSDSTALTTVSAPFFKHINPDFGLFYFPFAMLVIVAVSNAVNLTDGLDGLAIGPVIIAFAAYMLICYVTGNVKFTSYLSIQYIQQVDEMTIFCGAVVGASLGFLWYNCHPAALFMGNVGSTALGGLLGTVAIMSKQEFALILIGGIFVAEAVSVILQVYWYKTTGRRLFLMAPLHHHFEKLGWPESQVIVRFWIVALALALLSLSFLKIR